MNIWDLLPCDGTGVTLDRCYSERKVPMTRACAMQILAAEKLYGKGTMRPELLAEARQAMGGA